MWFLSTTKFKTCCLLLTLATFCIICQEVKAHSNEASSSTPSPSSSKKSAKEKKKQQQRQAQLSAKLEDFILDDYDIEYQTPTPSESVYFFETFDSVRQAKSRWIPSQAQKNDSNNNIVSSYLGSWSFLLPDRRIFPNDFGLVLTRSKARHAAISTKLHRKFHFHSRPLVVQYEVTFQNEMDCGGAYIKLITDSRELNLNEFNDKTPYTIMFGPDKCGGDAKLHFIFRHKNPLNGSYSEKHAKQPSNRMEETFTDKKPHLYRLVLRPDNKFEIFVDGLLINSGSLLEDMEPPVNPPIEIDDPHDFKPDDWDDRIKIPDANAVKPPDWDEDAPLKIPDPNAKVPEGWLENEPEIIVDPNAKKPEDWDITIDGKWEPPLIHNPKCLQALGCGKWTRPLVDNPNFRGKWRPPMIDNPNYKGRWKRRRIPNPDFFEDKEPFRMDAIGAVGLEIWTMTDNILFDNFIVADKESVVDDWTEKTFTLKIKALENHMKGIFHRILHYSNKYPWLYAVYTVGIGLPVAIMLAFCCEGTGNQKMKTEENDSHEYEVLGHGGYGQPKHIPDKFYKRVEFAENSQLKRRCTHHNHH